MRAGTTGVIAMLRDNTLHIGWLGDSQVSLCKQGRAVHLMDPHKPNRKVMSYALLPLVYDKNLQGVRAGKMGSLRRCELGEGGSLVKVKALESVNLGRCELWKVEV